MKGTFSLVFRGRGWDLRNIAAGAGVLKGEPRYERFCKPLLKSARSLRELPDRQEAELRADGVWNHAILGLAAALEALHGFAPETEAACRTMIEEYSYVDYLAPGVLKSVFTEIRLASAETYEGEDGGVAYIEWELPAEGGKTRLWKVEQDFRCFLHMWDVW